MKYVVNPLALGQSTPATQWEFAKANGSRGGRATQKRRRRAMKAAKGTVRKRKRTKRPARMVKGSAAARRYMASIRRKRRK
jgi:hypothetical protein